MRRTFAVTWDYRCPFARNAHDHVVTALQAGADWDVTFLPFSLGQNHVQPGEPSVWDEPHRDSGIPALQAAIVVRDRFPEQFLDLHHAMFEARHGRGAAIGQESVVRDVLTSVGIDADAVFAEVADGWPLKTIRVEHEREAADHAVWGVPTFIVGDEAAFVRFMHRADGDAEVARTTIERVVDLLAWPELNEFKHTSISR
jgi:protein-disulfide isomerase-like protein with CxxC motif